MGVTFVLGRPASNREGVWVDKIREIVQEDSLVPVLVIVPPQSTYSIECMLMERLGTEGIMGINVVSISRVAQRIQEEVHGIPQKTVGAAGKSMVIRHILDDNADVLLSLNRARSNYALPPLIGNVITELKQLAISPDMLRELEVQGCDTAHKFQDIALVYEQLNDLLSEYVDTEDKLELVTQYVLEAEFIKTAHVFIHGFDMYNEQTVRFITAVMQTAKHTTMSFLYADSNAPDGGVYGICSENRMRFYEAAQALGLETEIVLQDAPHSSDILHVQHNLFAYPAGEAGVAKDISISTACDMREEVDGVAAQIAYLKQKAKYCFTDMAVVCGNAESYLPLIRERFTAANIPCYTGAKRGLLQSNLADFILGAFELSRGKLKKDTLLKHAATGFCNVNRAQNAVLQNYAYENIRDGFAFLKEFEEPAETARQALMEPLIRLRYCAKMAKSARETVECVTAYMAELDIRKKVEEAVAEMRQQGQLESADYTEQAYERMNALLEQVAELPGMEQSGKKLVRMLKAGMLAEEISVIPPALDEVLCGDISGTYLPSIKILFVLGLNEGVVPNYSRAPDVFTEAERELILGNLVGLNHTGSMDKEKLAILKAFSRPKEKLYLSYIEDGKMQKSPLLERLQAMFEGIRINEMKKIVPLLARNAFELTAKGMRLVADGTQVEAGWQSVAASVLVESEFNDRLGVLQRGLESSNTARRVRHGAALYGEFKASATRVESYYACPYKHFINYGIRAYVPREHTVNQLDVGSYAHNVLDLISKEITQAGASWRELDKNQFAEILDTCTQKAREAQPKYLLNRHNETVLGAVENDVRIAAHMIREQCMQGELQPYATEQYFDVQGVQGVVDRIDVAQLNGKNYFSIVDYKTGARDFDINRLAAGLDLQLVIYIMAVYQLLGAEYAFAGANYMRIYGALRERQEALAPLYRMRGIEGVAADVAAQLYGREGNGLFSVNCQITKGGEYYATSAQRYFAEHELKVLVRYVETLIQRAKEEIVYGSNAILPAYDTKNGLPCDYCDYAGVCMFDKTDAASPLRPVERMGRDAALEAMENAMEES